MQEWWEKNFANCELGDQRLNKRAREIGKLLSQGFGKALSEIFPEVNRCRQSSDTVGETFLNTVSVLKLRCPLVEID